MSHKLSDLIDVPTLEHLTDSLFHATQMPTAIMDMDGVVLTASGWQDICAKYHRMNSEVEKMCIESDARIRKRIMDGEDFAISHCPMGLFDSAIPIVVDGVQLGNIFTGQILHETADRDAFRAQSRKYGFDESGYLEALAKVPIISEDGVRRNLKFLSDLADFIVELGQKKIEASKAEEEREALISNLEQKNIEMERFNYTVSHDLRSPLITIRGFTAAIEEELPSEQKTEVITVAIDFIKNATTKMRLLLEDLLELSRVGKSVKAPEEFALGLLVDEVLELLSGPINERSAKIDVEPDLPVVYADRNRITQVIQNLVENALKYMGEQEKPAITICTREQNGEAVFCVSDNGIGLDPAHAELIFELFHQLDPDVDGTGLGLTLVKRIIDLHDGRIWAESEGVGKGSTFCFTLPRQDT